MSNVPKSLDHIAPVFRVDSLERALAWYHDKLGFDVEFNHENFYASVMRDGCRIHLQCAPPAGRDQATFERQEHLDACIVVANARSPDTAYTQSIGIQCRGDEGTYEEHDDEDFRCTEAVGKAKSSASQKAAE